MKIALAQINTTIGDFTGNLAKIQREIDRALKERADLVVFPELAVTGYPPQDLLEQKHFIEASEAALQSLLPASQAIALLVGCVVTRSRPVGKPLYNAAALLFEGQIKGSYAKQLLPTYDVFDERRYFEPGEEPGLFTLKQRRVGVTICEDIWNDKTFWESPLYYQDPVEVLAAKKIDCLINLSASPYGWDKEALRQQMICAIARRHHLPIFFCNLVGGNDELVFDGHSLVVNDRGEIVAQAAAFQEDFLCATLSPAMPPLSPLPSDDPMERLFAALVVGVRDYTRKCGFAKVVLGLSGGIDSSLTAVIATEALGPQAVLGLLLPSRYTSRESLEDAEELAKRLGIRTETISIEPVCQALQSQVEKLFRGRPPDATEENLQARVRSNLLMAVSNKLGFLVLSTGNKSELAVGYCTLYGDLSGGLDVLADVPKTMVYRLAEWVNRRGNRIPERVLAKPPSAELRPNQKDQDTLPPYEVLDPILKGYIEEHLGRDSLIARDFEPETVDWVIRRVIANEYKRRQMPVGIKVSQKAFGIGRRFPIARKY